MSQIADTLAEALRVHQAGEYDQAQLLYEQILAQSPRNANAWNLLGTLHAQRGDHDEGERCIQNAIDIDDQQYAFYLNLAGVLRSQSRFHDAASAYRRVLAIRPDHGGAMLGLGSTLRQEGKLNDAIAMLKRAHELAPGNARVLVELGQTMLQAGRPQEALPLLSRVATATLDDADVLAGLGRALLALQRPHLAARPLRRAVRLAPNRPAMRNALASALLTIGHDRLALEQLDVAVEQVPDNAEFHANRGLALRRLERLGEAQRALERAVELAPRSAEFLFNLALTCEALGDYESAGRHAGRAAELKPDHGQSQLILARLERRQGHHQAAEERLCALVRTATRSHDRASAHYELARVFHEEERLADAVDAALQGNEVSLQSMASRRSDWTSLLNRVQNIAEWLRGGAFAAWAPVEIDEPAPPIFVVGLPHSELGCVARGMAGMGDVLVLHEVPIIPSLQMGIIDGSEWDEAALAQLDEIPAEEVVRLRRSYRATAESQYGGPNASVSRLIDVRAAGLLDLPFILRICPDARFIWVEQDVRQVCLNWVMGRFAIDEQTIHYLHAETANRLAQALGSLWNELEHALPDRCERFSLEVEGRTPEQAAQDISRLIGATWPSGVTSFVPSIPVFRWDAYESFFRESLDPERGSRDGQGA